MPLATSKKQLGGGHYRLTLTCENDACAVPGAPTFASTRIAQTDIDNGVFTPNDLFKIGDFLFETIYQVGDGMGNALTGLPAGNPPPLLGSGLRQQIGIEMTAELQGQLAAGKAQAASTNANVTVALRSKTRSFGSVVTRPDGTVDFTNLGSDPFRGSFDETDEGHLCP